MIANKIENNSEVRARLTSFANRFPRAGILTLDMDEQLFPSD